MEPKGQTSWATASGTDSLGSWVDCDFNDVTQRFRWIPPGRFAMGSPLTEMERERPQWGRETEHEVVITSGFWLGDTTCTQELWQAVTGYNPSAFRDPKNPVETVDWRAVQCFIESINGPGTLYRDYPLFRLPTEAEWEYAARANATTPFSFGHTISTEHANFNGERPYNRGKIGNNRQRTVEAKSFEPNPFGLYQMHGNVWEWCLDAYVKDLGEEPAVDPFVHGDTGSTRSVRGGSWRCPGHGARSAFRSFDHPRDKLDNLGFRICASARADQDKFQTRLFKGAE